MAVDVKTCNKCKRELPVAAFGREKRSQDGLRAACKECRNRLEKEYYERTKDKHAARVKRYRDANREEVRRKGRQYYADHKEEAKEYRDSHKEQIAEANRRYREENKDQIADCQRSYREKNQKRLAAQKAEYYEKNKEKISQYKKDWASGNRRRINKRVAKWKREKYATDIDFRITCNLRRRVNKALHGIAKSRSTLELLGCSVDELKRHLELQFEEGMSWDNYGDWHIDHIVPCAAFDMTNAEERKKCFHHTNLQPLWACDNLKKGSRVA